MRSLHWRGAVIAFALCAVIIPPTQAQVRPAVTKNVDEPGRTPYQLVLKAARSEASCGLNYCTFVSTAIPAGKRLVLTNVAATVNLGASAVLHAFRVSVIDSASVSLFSMYLPYRNTFSADPISIGSPRRWVTNESVRMYLEAGQRLYIDFHTTDGYLDADWPNMVLLTGYLVDLTQ